MERDTNMLFLAVTGGRDYDNPARVRATLSEYGTRDLTLVLGDATGVDTFAREWAEYNEVPYILNKADWATFGKAAGPIRNKKMVDQANMLLAFPGGRGTANCIQQAKEAGISVRRIT